MLVAVRVRATPDLGLGFGVLGTTLISVRDAAGDPTKWEYQTKDITTCDPAAAQSCQQWDTAVAPAGGGSKHVYFLGGMDGG